MPSRLWDRAAVVPFRGDDGEPAREPEIVALAPGMPSVGELFTFMRDAELRFATLKLRIEETTYGTRGEQIVAMDVALRHPGHARVVTSEAGTKVAGHHELWLSDGSTVWTYAAAHRLGTKRPIRNRPRALGEGDFPGWSKVYEPVTPLPFETLPELFVHPAGYCQNVLSTGETWISGTETVAGRIAILVECDHPRAVEWEADRPDFHIQVAVDRGDGVITRLIESIGGEITRSAEVTAYDPDAPLPDSMFEFTFPGGTTLLY
jgi:outer membrane lipoprotein-sorting protein